MRRSPLKRVSDKRRLRDASETDIYRAVKARSGGLCELATPACTHTAIEIHHRLLRKHGGPSSLANCRHVCGGCHRYSHMHPAEAYEHGWLLHPWEDVA